MDLTVTVEEEEEATCEYVAAVTDAIGELVAVEDEAKDMDRAANDLYEEIPGDVVLALLHECRCGSVDVPYDHLPVSAQRAMLRACRCFSAVSGPNLCTDVPQRRKPT